MLIGFSGVPAKGNEFPPADYANFLQQKIPRNFMTAWSHIQGTYAENDSPGGSA